MIGSSPENCAGILLALGLGAVCAGCTSWLAGQIVTAPGPDNTNYVTSAESREWFAGAYGFGHLEIPVGPPRATLVVTVINPRDYGLRYEFLHYRDDIIELDLKLKEPERLGPLGKPDRGTVIVLPGMLQSRFTMTFWGIGLAQRGYRVVLVDLRGHGDSTGRYLTYGIVESRDVLQVIGALADAGVLRPPVTLLGASYGAVTALMAAADSDEVDAVVALAPFTDAATAIDHLARAISPLLSRFVSRARMSEAIDRASEIGGTDLRSARAIDAVERIHVPLLFVHGREDNWVPPENSFRLYRAANGSASLMVIPDAGHMDLPMRYDQFSERVFDWLDDALEAPSSAPAVTSGTREVRPDVSS